MNRQELFDKAVAGLLAQDGPSVNESGFCVYFGPGNCRCAFGHLIPPEFEERVRVNHNAGFIVAQLLNQVPELGEVLEVRDESDLQFLEAMQLTLHDKIVVALRKRGVISKSEWKDAVRKEAKIFASYQTMFLKEDEA